MAYLVNLHQPCQACRLKPAIVELFDRRNQSVGKFCQECGQERLKRFQSLES